MSIITRIRSSVKPTLRPTAATVVLFDGGLPRKSSSFGRGILAAKPTHRLPCTLSDVEWAAQFFNTEVTAEDREFDRLADLAAVQDRYERGYCV